MKKNSKKLYKDAHEFFESAPSINQKAWGLINQFYHMVLTYMHDKKIKQSDLAQKLGKSRSAISQMFNKTPNLTIRKMVEIADAIGMDIQLISTQLDTKDRHKSQSITSIIYKVDTSSEVIEKVFIDTQKKTRDLPHYKECYI